MVALHLSLNDTWIIISLVSLIYTVCICTDYSSSEKKACFSLQDSPGQFHCQFPETRACLSLEPSGKFLGYFSNAPRGHRATWQTHYSISSGTQKISFMRRDPLFSSHGIFIAALRGMTSDLDESSVLWSMTGKRGVTPNSQRWGRVQNNHGGTKTSQWHQHPIHEDNVSKCCGSSRVDFA